MAANRWKNGAVGCLRDELIVKTCLLLKLGSCEASWHGAEAILPQTFETYLSNNSKPTNRGRRFRGRLSDDSRDLETGR